MFGYALLVVTLQLKISLIAGGLTLGFVMLPLILIGTHEALRAVDGSLREAAHSLGVSHAYLFGRVVWPIAWPAICTAMTALRPASVSSMLSVSASCARSSHSRFSFS